VDICEEAGVQFMYSTFARQLVRPNNTGRVEGVIVEVHDGCVGVDLKGRLGFLKIPMRMLITDYPIKVGQEVAWNMSFVEQMGPEINEKYVSNLDIYKRRQKEMRELSENNEEVSK